MTGNTELFGQLASTGVVGVLLVIALLALRDVYRQLNAAKDDCSSKIQAEMQARVDDAKRFNELSMSLQREIIEAVSKLGDMLDLLEKRDLERERERDREHRLSRPGDR